MRRRDEELADRFREVIIAGKHTRCTGVDDVAEQAAELRALHNFTLTDALQMAAALNAGCDGFITNDGAIKRMEGIQVLVIGELEL